MILSIQHHAVGRTSCCDAFARGGDCGGGAMYAAIGGGSSAVCASRSKPAGVGAAVRRRGP